MRREQILVAILTLGIMWSGAAFAKVCKLGDPSCQVNSFFGSGDNQCDESYKPCSDPKAGATYCFGIPSNGGEAQALYRDEDCCSTLTSVAGYEECPIEQGLAGYGSSCFGANSNKLYWKNCGCAYGFVETTETGQPIADVLKDLNGDIIKDAQRNNLDYSLRCSYGDWGVNSKCKLAQCNEDRRFFFNNSGEHCKYRLETRCGGFGCKQLYDCNHDVIGHPNNVEEYYRNENRYLDNGNNVQNFLPYSVEDIVSNERLNDGSVALIKSLKNTVSSLAHEDYNVVNRYVCWYKQSDGSMTNENVRDLGLGFDCNSVQNYCYLWKGCNEKRRWYNSDINAGIVYNKDNSYQIWMDTVERNNFYHPENLYPIINPVHNNFYNIVNPHYGVYTNPYNTIDAINGSLHCKPNVHQENKTFCEIQNLDRGCTYVVGDCHQDGDLYRHHRCWKKVSCTEEHRFYSSFINAANIDPVSRTHKLYNTSLNATYFNAYYAGLDPEKEIYPACLYDINNCNDSTGCYRKPISRGCATNFEDIRDHESIEVDWMPWFLDIRPICNDGTRCYQATACDLSMGAYSFSPNTSFFETISSVATQLTCYKGTSCNFKAGAYDEVQKPNTMYFETISSEATGSICYRTTGCNEGNGAYSETPNTSYFLTNSSQGSQLLTCYRARGCNLQAGAYVASQEPNSAYFITSSSDQSSILCYRAEGCNVDNGAYRETPNTMYFITSYSSGSGSHCWRGDACNDKLGAYSETPNTSFFLTSSSEASGFACWRAENCNKDAGAYIEASKPNTVFFDVVYSNRTSIICYRGTSCRENLGSYDFIDPEYFRSISSVASGSTCYRATACNIEGGAYTYSPNTIFFDVGISSATGSTCYRGKGCNVNLGSYPAVGEGYFYTISSEASDKTCYRATGCINCTYATACSTEYFVTSKSSATNHNCQRSWCNMENGNYSSTPNEAFFNVAINRCCNTTCYRALGCATSEAAYSENPNTLFFETISSEATSKVCYRVTDCRESVGAYSVIDEQYFYTDSSTLGFTCYRATACATGRGALTFAPNSIFFEVGTSSATGSTCYRGTNCNVSLGSYDMVDRLYFNVEVSTASGKNCYRAKNCASGAYNSTPDTSYFVTSSSTATSSTCWRADDCRLETGTYGFVDTVYFTISEHKSTTTCYRATGCEKGAYASSPNTQYFIVSSSTATSSTCWRADECDNSKGSYADVNTLYFNRNQHDSTITCYTAIDCASGAYPSEPDPDYFRYSSSSATGKTCYRADGCDNDKGSYVYVDPAYFNPINSMSASNITCYRAEGGCTKCVGGTVCESKYFNTSTSQATGFTCQRAECKYGNPDTEFFLTTKASCCGQDCVVATGCVQPNAEICTNTLYFVTSKSSWGECDAPIDNCEYECPMGFELNLTSCSADAIHSGVNATENASSCPDRICGKCTVQTCEELGYISSCNLAHKTEIVYPTKTCYKNCSDHSGSCVDNKTSCPKGYELKHKDRVCSVCGKVLEANACGYCEKKEITYYDCDNSSGPYNDCYNWHCKFEEASKTTSCDYDEDFCEITGGESWCNCSFTETEETCKKKCKEIDETESCKLGGTTFYKACKGGCEDGWSCEAATGECKQQLFNVSVEKAFGTSCPESFARIFAGISASLGDKSCSSTDNSCSVSDVALGSSFGFSDSECYDSVDGYKACYNGVSNSGGENMAVSIGGGKVILADKIQADANIVITYTCSVANCEEQGYGETSETCNAQCKGVPTGGDVCTWNGIDYYKECGDDLGYTKTVDICGEECKNATGLSCTKSVDGEIIKYYEECAAQNYCGDGNQCVDGECDCTFTKTEEICRETECKGVDASNKCTKDGIDYYESCGDDLGYTKTEDSCDDTCLGVAGLSCKKTVGGVEVTYYESCGDTYCGEDEECTDGKCGCSYTLTAENCNKLCKIGGLETCTRDGTVYFKECGEDLNYSQTDETCKEECKLVDETIYCGTGEDIKYQRCQADDYCGGGECISGGCLCPSGSFTMEPDSTFFKYDEVAKLGNGTVCYGNIECNSPYYPDAGSEAFKWTSSKGTYEYGDLNACGTQECNTEKGWTLKANSSRCSESSVEHSDGNFTCCPIDDCIFEYDVDMPTVTGGTANNGYDMTPTGGSVSATSSTEGCDSCTPNSVQVSATYTCDGVSGYTTCTISPTGVSCPAFSGSFASGCGDIVPTTDKATIEGTNTSKCGTREVKYTYNIKQGAEVISVCPSDEGWFGDKPDDNVFTYDTKLYGATNCYKVTNCKDEDFESCDKDHYEVFNYHDQKTCYTSCTNHAGSCAADLTEEDCTNAGKYPVYYDRVCHISSSGTECGHIIEEDGCISCSDCTSWSSCPTGTYTLDEFKAIEPNYEKLYTWEEAGEKTCTTVGITATGDKCYTFTEKTTCDYTYTKDNCKITTVEAKKVDGDTCEKDGIEYYEKCIDIDVTTFTISFTGTYNHNGTGSIGAYCEKGSPVTSTSVTADFECNGDIKTFSGTATCSGIGKTLNNLGSYSGFCLGANSSPTFNGTCSAQGVSNGEIFVVDGKPYRLSCGGSLDEEECAYTKTIAICRDTECKDVDTSKSCEKDGVKYYESCGNDLGYTKTKADCDAECLDTGLLSCKKDEVVYYQSCGITTCNKDQECVNGDCKDCKYQCGLDGSVPTFCPAGFELVAADLTRTSDSPASCSVTKTNTDKTKCAKCKKAETGIWPDTFYVTVSKECGEEFDANCWVVASHNIGSSSPIRDNVSIDSSSYPITLSAKVLVRTSYTQAGGYFSADGTYHSNSFNHFAQCNSWSGDGISKICEIENTITGCQSASISPATITLIDNDTGETTTVTPTVSCSSSDSSGLIPGNPSSRL